MASREEIDRLFQNAQRTIINDARAKKTLLSQLSDAINMHTPEKEREEMRIRIFTHLDKLGLQAADTNVTPLDKLMKQKTSDEDWPIFDREKFPKLQ